MTIAQQLGRINAGVEASTKVREFINLARIIALSRGNPANAAALVHDHRVLMGPRIQSIVAGGGRVYDLRPDLVSTQKAAISAGTTTDASWALPLAEYQTIANAFLESLRNFGAFDRMLGSMRRVPLRTRVGWSSVGITGATVGQAQVKPVGRLTLSTTTLDELKAIALVVVTKETVRFSQPAAGDLFAADLSNEVAVKTDEQFISVLTSGATSITSSGGTAEHVRHDLRSMLAAITTSARSQLFLLMPPAISKIITPLHTTTGAAAFPTMGVQGGQIIGGVEAVVSDGVPANTMVLVDAQQIAAASETLTLSASDQASVQMDSAPDSRQLLRATSSRSGRATS